jgi:hypothetical protein
VAARLAPGEATLMMENIDAYLLNELHRELSDIEQYDIDPRIRSVYTKALELYRIEGDDVERIRLGKIENFSKASLPSFVVANVEQYAANKTDG